MLDRERDSLRESLVHHSQEDGNNGQRQLSVVSCDGETFPLISVAMENNDHGEKNSLLSENVQVSGSENTMSLHSAYFILAALVFTFVTNQWTRQSIYYLCDFSESGDAYQHINVDLSFSEEAYATLATVVFYCVFAPCSLYAGSFSDKHSRRWICIGSCAVWSAATALQGQRNSLLYIKI